MTGTSQYSPYQHQISGNETVGTDDCGHERHAGATEDTSICSNQPDNVKEEALLMELQ